MKEGKNNTVRGKMSYGVSNYIPEICRNGKLPISYLSNGASKFHAWWEDNIVFVIELGRIIKIGIVFVIINWSINYLQIVRQKL